jgi:hypothetical protein
MEVMWTDCARADLTQELKYLAALPCPGPAHSFGAVLVCRRFGVTPLRSSVDVGEGDIEQRCLSRSGLYGCGVWMYIARCCRPAGGAAREEEISG